MSKIARSAVCCFAAAYIGLTIYIVVKEQLAAVE